MPTIVNQSAFLLFLCVAAAMANATSEPLTYEEQTLQVGGTRQVARVPKGYRLTLLADKLDGPRLLTFADNKDLFIGSKSGMIYRVPPPYNLPEVLVRLDGYPHSMAFRRGEILIARTDGLYRAPYQPDQKSIAPESVTLLARLPGGSGHSSRTVGVGPDGRVYVGLGIQGNCSDQYLGDSYPFDERRGGIFVLREEGGKARWEAYGSGLRNPVGFAWHPKTGVMYASNNGPDHWGYEQPPEYFSRVTAGSFHGMPWFQFDGQQLKRDDCVPSTPPRPLADVATPVATFPARNAPMGVTFVPKGALSKALEFDAIVALRGSWGTQPSGGALGDRATRRPPKIVAVRFKDGEAMRVDDLVTGFQLANGDRWARPVGVAVGPDGALYFTSDSGMNGLFRLGVK
ncbi:MAG: sugar dehydrogenase [Candidatus Muproteobacteria bacterium RIFCSPHIGHO2_12_FULL_60_33]|uniref:Sugar dehydrogenase n=1 Tax=Candidatus Muproteobacteria bacterium RIFCSPLOWO2_01_FULL_60_18 TaxID=1817768 RepID=A0A1F6TY03_9PROT|nr:MAG: sugar dehydrogenase [Candidatus Muproteobacteria bacterium RIFCSPHIGHO2_01_60_12]OGI49976.1 MAG: sugar dehydrogenase [Candidatus Muproteobacteria bacterium RIFCSPLOWO2_01_FULL_60_18]OGI54675.1 MAG: sugar dehydrogenase [Candidatus Muproteobacteria bacterium RIFCSPHIGHO2_12_FULL_60_33]